MATSERSAGARSAIRAPAVQMPGDDAEGVVAALPGPPPGDQSAAARVAGAQGDVLGHRHPRHEPEVLVDEGHVPGGRRGPERVTGHGHLALVGVMDPGEHLDEGGLSGAVGAEQGEDVAPVDVEVDGGQGGSAAEALAEPADADERCSTEGRGRARRGVGSVMHRLLRGSASEFFPTARAILCRSGGVCPAFAAPECAGQPERAVTDHAAVRAHSAQMTLPSVV